MLMSGRLLVEGKDDELHFDLSSHQLAKEMQNRNLEGWAEKAQSSSCGCVLFALIIA